MDQVFQNVLELSEIHTHAHTAQNSLKVKVLVARFCLILLRPVDCARSAPLSMEFSRQEYCSGLPFPSPGHLPDPAIKPRSPALQADSLST